jgi:uncharacterized protein (DUF1499 family)
MRIIIGLFAIAALGMGAAILAAAPGYRFDFWGVRTAFGIYNILGAPQKIVGPISVIPVFGAAVLSFAGGVIALANRGAKLGLLAVIAALFGAGAGMIPVELHANGKDAPFIHDITTDFENPPAIVAGAAFPRNNPPEYDGPQKVRGSDMTVAEEQRRAYPEIQPMTVSGGIENTAEKVRSILKRMNIKILDETVNDSEWVFEAVHTTPWFGFKDDFVVRLTSEGAATRMDVRSKSRIGGSDIGKNARRVRSFMAHLEKAASAAPA